MSSLEIWSVDWISAKISHYIYRNSFRFTVYHLVRDLLPRQHVNDCSSTKEWKRQLEVPNVYLPEELYFPNESMNGNIDWISAKIAQYMYNNSQRAPRGGVQSLLFTSWSIALRLTTRTKRITARLTYQGWWLFVFWIGRVPSYQCFFQWLLLFKLQVPQPNFDFCFEWKSQSISLLDAFCFEMRESKLTLFFKSPKPHRHPLCEPPSSHKGIRNTYVSSYTNPLRSSTFLSPSLTISIKRRLPTFASAL